MGHDSKLQQKGVLLHHYSLVILKRFDEFFLFQLSK